MSDRRMHAVVIGAVIVLAGTAAAPLPAAIRVPIGVLLTLWVPGHAVMAALDPGRQIRGYVRAVVTLAVATAVSLLVGIAAGSVGHLTATPIAAGIAVVATAAYGWAAAHGWRPPRLDAVEASLPRRRTIGVAIAGAVMLSTAAVIGATPLGSPAPNGYSTLSVLPDRDGRSARVAVANNEGGDRRYSVIVERTDRPRTLLWSFTVDVPAFDTVRRTIAIPGGPGARRIDVSLILLSQPNAIYRRARVTVPAAAAFSGAPRP